VCRKSSISLVWAATRAARLVARGPDQPGPAADLTADHAVDEQHVAGVDVR
jgi:hypothetical protein